MKKIIILLLGLFLSIQTAFGEISLCGKSPCSLMKQEIFLLRLHKVKDVATNNLAPLLTEKGSILIDSESNIIVVKDIKDSVSVIKAKINELEGVLSEPVPIEPKVKQHFKTIDTALMTVKQKKAFDGSLARGFPNGTNICEDKSVLYLGGSDNQLKSVEQELKKRKIASGEAYMAECCFTRVVTTTLNHKP